MFFPEKPGLLSCAYTVQENRGSPYHRWGYVPMRVTPHSGAKVVMSRERSCPFEHWRLLTDWCWDWPRSPHLHQGCYNYIFLALYPDSRCLSPKHMSGSRRQTKAWLDPFISPSFQCCQWINLLFIITCPFIWYTGSGELRMLEFLELELHPEDSGNRFYCLLINVSSSWVLPVCCFPGSSSQSLDSESPHNCFSACTYLAIAGEMLKDAN